MKYRVVDDDGRTIHPEIFIPWEELWFLKRSLLVSVGFGLIVWH